MRTMLEPAVAAAMIGAMAREKRLEDDLAKSPDDQLVQFGLRLKHARESAGFTYKSVAEAIGISDRTLGSWERAERTPNVIDVGRLADLYRVTVDELLGRKPVAGRAILDSAMVSQILAVKRPGRQANKVVRDALTRPTPLQVSVTIPEGADWASEEVSKATYYQVLEHAERIGSLVDAALALGQNPDAKAALEISRDRIAAAVEALTKALDDRPQPERKPADGR